MTRILHTADWHLGARLMDQDRTEEHARFLEWLLEQIKAHNVHLLVVAGDIFDQVNPPQSALALYYNFLTRLTSQTTCDALVVGGNHDSAPLLDAPRGLLAALRVTVLGCAPPSPEDCIREYENVVVAAVPFLRERDIRTAAPGQSQDAIAESMRVGIRDYYVKALEAARGLANGRAIIATGHLTTVGASQSGSERDIHIGNLGAVDAGCFEGYDYVALGHIHRPQLVGGNARVRYVGSPIALGFDESSKEKQVLLVDMPTGMDGAWEITSLPVPCARELLRISCKIDDITGQLIPTDPQKLPPWIEWTIEDGAGRADVDRLVKQVSQAAGAVPLKIICPRAMSDPSDVFSGRELGDLKPVDIFLERLRREGIETDSETHNELIFTFQELLDCMAESATEADAAPSTNS